MLMKLILLAIASTAALFLAHSLPINQQTLEPAVMKHAPWSGPALVIYYWLFQFAFIGVALALASLLRM